MGRRAVAFACALVASPGCSKGPDGSAASGVPGTASSARAPVPAPPPALVNTTLPAGLKRAGLPVHGETQVSYVLGLGFTEDGLVQTAKELHERWPEVRHDLYRDRVDPKNQVGQVYKKLLNDEPGKPARPIWVFQYDVRGGVLDGGQDPSP